MWSDRTPEEWAENKFGRSKGEIAPPVEAIRKKCLDCCCGSKKEVRLCPSCDCYLYPYRFGEDPRRKKRKYTEEQKEAMRLRMQAARSKANANKKSSLSSQDTLTGSLVSGKQQSE